MNQKLSKKDIAVIGLSGKFPHSESIEEFWSSILNGKELVHFYEEDELRKLGLEMVDSNKVWAKSFIDNPGNFDPSFFGYTMEEARFMDPQVRMFHEHTWNALEDAGYDPFTYAEKIGVYASATDNINWRAHAMMAGTENVDPYFLSQISNKNFLSTLISYKLNLRGPSFCIDSGCSSSLVAIHLACRSLLMKECTLAIAGGVSLNSTTDIGYSPQAGMIFSKDGHCKTFDSDSSGTISGEGIGVVVLKRLSEAVIDGDHIYAIVKSSAVNNDGNNKVGYTAPSIQGQRECIKLAHKISGVEPSSITFVEAHGTATKLGDPIEIEALNQAFGNNKQKICAIGSVKSNMGHLDAAAGVAGFIKTALTLKKKIIPPTLHFKSPNSEINFEEGPFFVNTEPITWKKINDIPLRAGVSSFGIGGTNAHVVMEESPIFTPELEGRSYKLIRFSAKSPISLNNYANKLKTFLQVKNDVDLNNLGFTLQTGRANFDYRAFITADDPSNAIKCLQNQLVEKQCGGGRTPKLIFMFPGQGSQFFKMGMDLYTQEPYFRNLLDIGFDIIREFKGEDYQSVIFGNDNYSEDSKIDKTIYTQPLIFIYEYALASLLIHWGLSPDVMIGHSIGEYVAACLSNVFSFKDGIKLILKRAELMDTIEGRMLSVGISAEKIQAFLTKNCYISVINSSKSCVVSGTEESINNLRDVFIKEKIVNVEVNMSTVSHCPMNNAIVDDFKRELSSIELREPKHQFISNVSGKYITPKEAVDLDYWCKHLTNPVKFWEGITELNKENNCLLVEVGPGRTLSSFVKQNEAFKASNSVTIQITPWAREKVSGQEKLLKGIGEIWLNGIDINWAAYYENETPRKISAPTYSFNKLNFPSNVNLYEQILKPDLNLAFPKKEIRNSIYYPSWKRSLTLSALPEIKSSLYYLVFTSGGELEERLSGFLKEKGNKLIKVIKGEGFEKLSDELYAINPNKMEDFSMLGEKLLVKNFLFDQVIYSWGLDQETETEFITTSNKFQLNCLLNLLRGLKIQESERRLVINYITNEMYDVIGNQVSGISNASAIGLLKVSLHENPNLNGRNLDLDLEENMDDLIPKLAEEINSERSDFKVAFRRSGRWLEHFEPIDFLNNSDGNIKLLKPGGVYLITGGLGNVGQLIAEYLLSNYNAKVILMGRSNLDLLNGVDNKVDILNRLRSLGGAVLYGKVDLANRDAVKDFLNKSEREIGKINGIIHAAGCLDKETFKVIEKLEDSIIDKHFNPKVDGTFNLFYYFEKRELDFFWATSSLSNILGGLTYGAYAAANNFLSSFIEYHKHTVKNWIGLEFDGLDFTGKNSALINREDFIEIFEQSLNNPISSRLVISLRDLRKPFLDKEVKPKNEGSLVKLSRPTIGTEYVAPTSPIQKDLVELWAEFFGINKIGIKDDFFELGGDSLKAMTICKRIEKLFGVEIALMDFFSNCNIEQLGEEVSTAMNIKKVKNSSSNPENIIVI